MSKCKFRSLKLAFWMGAGGSWVPFGWGWASRDALGGAMGCARSTHHV